MSIEKNWRLRGQCLDVDPDLMHPDPRDRNGHTIAKAICRGCPVQTECFIDSIRVRDFGGVRAGMSGEERKDWFDANHPEGAQRRRNVAQHHDAIARMVAANAPWPEIAQAVGFPYPVVRAYWRFRGKNRQEVAA